MPATAPKPERAFDHERMLADQLERASTSIALNIAEGSGEYSRKEKAGFYRMALRSVTECAAILDVVGRLKALPEENRQSGKRMLHRLAAMLIALARRNEGT